MVFSGYRRADGGVGIRNHVLILPTVACSNETCRIISEEVPGAVSLINQGGCGEVAGNLKITQRVLAGLVANPNVFGVLLVGLGCELNQVKDMDGIIGTVTNKPVKTLLIQEQGGTLNTITQGVRIAQEMVLEASSCEREEFDISNLTVGLECGGSDSSSGLAANPVVGRFSDLLVRAGGTIIFSETTEMIGAEHILAERAASPEIGARIYEIVKAREKNLQMVHEDLRSGQPSPGNRAGGLSTIEEKSLGCIHKGGTSPVVEVIDYSEQPKKKGLVIMDTPGYDVVSVTAKVAGGCQMVIFTTGRGNPVGNPLAPVLKVTANRDTFLRMRDNIDMDLSDVLDGTTTLHEKGSELMEEVVRVANGKRTKAEALGLGLTETIISRMCDYV